MYAPYLVSRQCKAPNYSQAWDTDQKPSFMPRPGELGSTSCLLPCRCQSLAFGAGSWLSYPKPCPNLTSKINRVPLGSNIPCNQHWPGQAFIGRFSDSHLAQSNFNPSLGSKSHGRLFQGRGRQRVWPFCLTFSAGSRTAAAAAAAGGSKHTQQPHKPFGQPATLLLG